MNKSFNSQPVAAFAAAAAVVATFGVASFIDFLATGPGDPPDRVARAKETPEVRAAATQVHLAARR